MQKRILFVDDEISILKMLTTAFTSFGYDVVTANSAETALEVLSREKIYCIFTDLRLDNQGGMDGIQLCREIRKSNPIAIVFAMTGYANVFELFDCREAGFDDYFLKPLELEVINQAAERAFEKMSRWRQKKEVSRTA